MFVFGLKAPVLIDDDLKIVIVVPTALIWATRHQVDAAVTLAFELEESAPCIGCGVGSLTVNVPNLSGSVYTQAAETSGSATNVTGFSNGLVHHF